MGIGPIPAIHAVPITSSRGNGLDVPAVFEVKDSSRAGDETYNGKGKESTGGQDDETDDLLDEDSEPESTVPVLQNNSGGQVNFFA
ncbi:MAG: hypothetical protein P4K94_04785 [Terracidiphilus sp.]|nr:hypothetical protein [Terracidiphilus sp.]